MEDFDLQSTKKINKIKENEKIQIDQYLRKRLKSVFYHESTPGHVEKPPKILRTSPKKNRIRRVSTVKRLGAILPNSRFELFIPTKENQRRKRLERLREKYPALSKKLRKKLI